MALPSLADLIEVHSVQDTHTFATGSGALVSLFRVDGLTRVYGRQEDRISPELLKRLYDALPSFFQTPGHRLQWTLARDPDWADAEVEAHFSALDVQARRVGLQSKGFTQGPPIERLKQQFLPERSYLALWTEPNILNPADLKAERRDLDRQLEDVTWGPWQILDPGLGLRGLIPIHEAACEALLESLGPGTHRVGLRLVRLNTREAIVAWRQILEPSRGEGAVFDADNPPLITDPFGPAIPKIARQVLPSYAKVVDKEETIFAGGLYYQVLTMGMGPARQVDFGALFSSLPRDLPWRYTLTLTANNGSGWLKSLLAGLLSWSNAINHGITRARKQIFKRDLLGDPACMMQVLACTWGKTLNEALTNARRLKQRFEGWGNVQVEEIFGDPFENWISLAPGLRPKGNARWHGLNLSDACAFVPVASQASPWHRAPLLLRGQQGQLLPLAIGSSRQKNFNIAIFAATRSGKSVFLALLLLLAHLLEAGRVRLPRFAFLDVGYGGIGAGQFLRELLGPRAELVQTHRLRNTLEYAINPFDTLLGHREPLALHRAFLIDFLTQVCTPMGKEEAPEHVYEMAASLIDAAYLFYSDQHPEGQPKRWNSGQPRMQAVDAWVERARERGTLPPDPTWWQVVDALFQEGKIEEAYSAQRFAVPLLPDLPEVANTAGERFAAFRKITVKDGELSVFDFMMHLITQAQVQYPVISAPTAFNLGVARGVILDLNEVTAGQGGDANKRTTIFYLLARWVTVGQWFVHTDDLEHIPETYLAYHADRIQEILEDPKFAIYDEFHRTNGSKSARRVVDRDARENGKFNIRLAISSQVPTDFDKEFLEEHVASRFILSAPENTQQLVETFGLNAEEERLLKSLNGPGPHGSNILALLDTREGPYRLFCSDPVPLEWLWAFNTTAEDRAIFRRLCREMSASEARALAAARFGASAKSLLEEVARNDLTSQSSDQATEAAADHLARSVLQEWHRDWIQRALESLGYQVPPEVAA
jgi:intracellular multiplication protein IcmB